MVYAGSVGKQLPSKSMSSPRHCLYGTGISFQCCPRRRSFQPKRSTTGYLTFIFLSPPAHPYAELNYCYDDGLTLGYTKGIETKLLLQVSLQGEVLDIQVRSYSQGYQPLRLNPVVYSQVKSIQVRFGDELVSSPAQAGAVRFFDTPIAAWLSERLSISDGASGARLILGN